MHHAKVYVKLPKAGLGNMLLTWSRAYLFAQLNNLEMHTSAWTKIHYGAWRRRENKKRLYGRYFKEQNLLKSLRFLYYFIIKKKIIEPPVEEINDMRTDKIFLFKKIFNEYDFFRELRPHKQAVKSALEGMLKPHVKARYKLYPKPVIGLHVRRGDFKRGSTITPVSFFIEVVNGLRKNAGSELPVTVFTDAEPREIKGLLALGNIILAEPKPDILDILLLAESRIVVLSIGSTFSYWAAFLSEGMIIKNKGEWHVPFREIDDLFYQDEVIWDLENNDQEIFTKLSLIAKCEKSS